MAKRKQQEVNTSKITLGGVRAFAVISANSIDMCQKSTTVYRHTEQQAEQRMNAGHLSQMHHQLMYLERVGLSPKKYYKTFPAAPNNPLWGTKLYSWIGEQVGWTASDVELALENASDILIRMT